MRHSNYVGRDGLTIYRQICAHFVLTVTEILEPLQPYNGVQFIYMECNQSDAVLEVPGTRLVFFKCVRKVLRILFNIASTFLQTLVLRIDDE